MVWKEVITTSTATNLTSVLQFTTHGKIGNVCMYNVTFKHVHVTPVAAKKQYYIFQERAFAALYSAWNVKVPYCHLLPTLFYNIFPHYLINGTIIEKTLLDVKCVFQFPLQLLYETFLNLRITEGYMIQNCIGLQVKYPLFLSSFNAAYIFSKDF